MIKFFRRIRQKLLSENKFSKYLLYAIGEIVLVVIGILIALQINTWNQDKIQKTEEQKLIRALIGEIKNNIDSLATNLETSRHLYQQTDRFLKRAAVKEITTVAAAKMPTLFGYTSNRTETSVLREILGTDSRALISNQLYINQLRKLKQNFDRNDKTLYYVDAYWNGQILEYFNETGVGVHFAESEALLPMDRELKITSGLLSRLGIMNGLHESLILSRKDLSNSLKETLKLLQQE